MTEDAVRVGHRLLTASRPTIDAMRLRLQAVPTAEKPDIAYRASTMVRQAAHDRQLSAPLRGDVEDAVAMLLVLGVTAVPD